MNKSTYYRILKSIEDRQYKKILAGQMPMQHPGWIKHIRQGFGMSFRQLGKKLGITSVSASELQRRELEGTVTINSLREAANALGFDLFYMFVPKDKNLSDKPLQKMVERQAYEAASNIARRASVTMKLEDQETSLAQEEESIAELAEKIRTTLPHYLWD